MPSFRAGSIVHPLGKALFVFAGGTSHTYQDFEKTALDRKDLKGPDFVSRLRGHINIKGPNRAERGADPAHVIRRAIILRSLLERDYPNLIDPSSKRCQVSDSVVRGFLRVARYEHGARSLESLLSMSQLAGARVFDISQLPPVEQLEMHVSADFLQIVREGELSCGMIEPLAKACHEAYVRELDAVNQKIARENEKLLAAGLSEKRLENLPPAREYAQLDEGWKESNRNVARVAQAKLAEAGFAIHRRPPTNQPVGAAPNVLDAKKDMLATLEHDRWLREKLIQGFDYGAVDDPQQKTLLRRNPHIMRYCDLPPDKQTLDFGAAAQMERVLWDQGYQVGELPK